MNSPPYPDDLPGVQGDDDAITGQTSSAHMVARSGTSLTEPAKLAASETLTDSLPLRLELAAWPLIQSPTAALTGEWPELHRHVQKGG
jgi:hypothetical protein